MTAFEFMANSPFLTIVLACLAFGLLRALAEKAYGADLG